ncbi:hypothetical protein CYMTET_39801 [Cymbomonas tetramitiformis]|uniref:Uncharacterized protein n=1 Tax=Cymbomonas tetramitiformis TaxID=36881 RepID=A0AAE0CAT4_9CHLO|nr:hypothetical protein CYMTET_39801 [Cymbomonas tetramitiformis]
MASGEKTNRSKASDGVAEAAQEPVVEFVTDDEPIAPAPPKVEEHSESSHQKKNCLSEDSSRPVLHLEKIILHLRDVKEKNDKRIEEDESAIRKITETVEETKPKLEALKLVLDLKERKRAAIIQQLKEQCEMAAKASGEAGALINSLKSKSRSLAKNHAATKMIVDKGFNARDSVKSLREGKTQAIKTTLATGKYDAQTSSIHDRTYKFERPNFHQTLPIRPSATL